MIKQTTISLFLVLIMLAGCSTGEEEIIVNKESIDDIEEIKINFASTDVMFSPSETNELEAFLTVYDDGPGAILVKSSKQLSIELDTDITRLFNLSKKPTLEVKIPMQFKEKIILDGSSGTVTGKELIQNDIEIRSSSGHVKLHFIEFNNDVKITTTSGKVAVNFDEKQPNLDLDIQTNSGRQSIDLTLYGNSQPKKGLQRFSGNGDHKMQIVTKSGNIDLN
ncbi:hypothetical protein AMS59_22465 [Lysinibacillus sp. FJAT-14745]|uniref:DUF4097 family beta strand repeat-containing protein n=1 Tax=Lysinibacillus sp. FJAT-14745 TaxID=1704289 RepID=UPI0006AB8050|nr:DUF4097 family beta strand repeat-containing protein [Lysinibacillus sp. FJAT-14745]KOP69689.1 hypothetical protein AMS59_22465 [Lysinibacillus sp. FJAT-14745]